MMCILSSAASFPASSATADSDAPQYSSDGSSSPSSHVSTDSLSDPLPTLKKEMGSSVSKQDKNDLVKFEECSKESNAQKSDISSDELDVSGSLRGWRRLLVKAGEKWSVQFVSPDGETRFESHEEMMAFIQKNNINAGELHFLSEDENEVTNKRTIPLTFCNMRANILDMRKRKCRKRSQGSRQGSIDLLRRKSSTTSDDEPPEKIPIADQLSSIDECLEEPNCSNGNVESAFIRESQMANASDKDEPRTSSVSTIPDPTVFHQNEKENLESICDSKENDCSVLNAVSNQPESTPAKSLPAIATFQPESLIAIPFSPEDPTEATAQEHPNFPCTSPTTEKTLSIMAPDFETKLPLLAFKSETPQEPSPESPPQRCSTPEKSKDVKIIGVQVRRRSSLCHLDEMNVSEECEDEIVASNDIHDFSEEDEDEGVDDSQNNSFLSSFFSKIQQDEKYNCRIPIVDIFEHTPLSSFICYGCSGAYNADNQFTINLKCQTMQIICSQCAWWTSRKISCRQKDYEV